MKALVLSDIHSNIYALEAIWAKEQDSDVVYCAGDLVDYGPYPQEVLDWIRAHHVTCVQGNHDRYVALCYRSGDTLERVSEAERAWAHHNASLLHEQDVTFLEQLPRAISLEMDGTAYGMTHLYRQYDEIVSLHAYEEFRVEVFPVGETHCLTRLILGHTHRQCVRYLSDELLWLNPGSVSYRRRDDPDQTAHYVTITDGQISLQRLAYNIEPLRCAIRRSISQGIRDSCSGAVFWPSLDDFMRCSRANSRLSGRTHHGFAVWPIYCRLRA